MDREANSDDTLTTESVRDSNNTIKAKLGETIKIIDVETQKHKNHGVKLQNSIEQINRLTRNALRTHLKGTKATVCTTYSKDNFVCQKIGGTYVSSEDDLSMGYPVLRKTSTNVVLLLSLGVKWNEKHETYKLTRVEIGRVEKTERDISINSTITFSDGPTIVREGHISYNSTASLRDVIPLYSCNDLDVKAFSSYVTVMVEAERNTFSIQIDNCPQLIRSGSNESGISMFTEWTAYTIRNIDKCIEELGENVLLEKTTNTDNNKYYTRIRDRLSERMKIAEDGAHIQNINLKRVLSLQEGSMRDENEELLSTIISFIKEEKESILSSTHPKEKRKLREEAKQKDDESTKRKSLDILLGKIFETIDSSEEERVISNSPRNTTFSEIHRSSGNHDGEYNEDGEDGDNDDDYDDDDDDNDEDDDDEEEDDDGDDGDELMAFADRLARRIHRLGLLNLVPPLTTKIEKIEKIRDFPMLEWSYPHANHENPISIQKKRRNKKNKRKTRRSKTVSFSLLREVEHLGGNTNNLKMLFKDMHNMANEDELIEFNSCYDQYKHTIEGVYLNALYNRNLSEKFSWDTGCRMRRTLRLYMTASLFSSRYPKMHKIVNRERKRYLEYIIRYTLFSLIDAMTIVHGTDIKERMVRTIVDHLSDHENLLEFTSALKIWMCEFQNYATGQYWLDGISATSGTLEKGPTGESCALFTPIAKHMRVMKIRKRDFCSDKDHLAATKGVAKDRMYQRLSRMNSNPLLLINLTTGEGILSIASSSDRYDNHTIVEKSIGGVDTINFRHIVRPFKRVTLKRNRSTEENVQFVDDGFDLGFVDIFLDRKHWIEILKNRGLFDLVAVGKLTTASRDDKKTNSSRKSTMMNNANSINIKVMSSLYDEYGRTISHIPDEMIQDMNKLLGVEGFKRAIRAQAPSKIRIVICDGDDDVPRLLIDANHCYSKCDSKTIAFPIRYVSSMFTPRYSAGVTKKLDVGPPKKEDKNFDIIFKRHQSNCDDMSRRINEVHKCLVNLERKRRSLASRIREGKVKSSKRKADSCNNNNNDDKNNSNNSNTERSTRKKMKNKGSQDK
uniref:Uncharacterized protein n=1 Tax=Penaeus semisulcatus majanivirus TaxID=2984274 RepID=A0A9C7F7Q4_9VIRU|nr:MAG: hypothetical protein [Penaeus semisulcatus majanivirus]